MRSLGVGVGRLQPLLGGTRGGLIPKPRSQGRPERTLPCALFPHCLYASVLPRGLLMSRNGPPGVPTVAQQDQWRLCSTRTQVHSPARCSGFRVRHCCRWDKGHNCGYDLFPGPGTPDAVGRPKRKKKKKKRTPHLLQGLPTGSGRWGVSATCLSQGTWAAWRGRGW